MKIIIGLGNPGIKYKNNRHNAGFLVAEQLKNQISNFQFPISNQFIITKSKNFMNDSGSFVLAQYTKYHIPYTSLFIVHDDLDIKLGEFKIQFGKGPKVHNGLNDIYEKLGTNEFWHVRVGVDPTSRGALRGEQLVLSDFTPEEKVILERVIKQICNQLVA
jgi:PTH1 family peptidyl-tRNA hydrolase